MKKIIAAVIVLQFCSTITAQNVGIGTTTPHNSAMLDVSSSNKGILVPRTSTTSRIAIVNPAKGLLLYDTIIKSFWFHDGIAWIESSNTKNSWSSNGNANTIDANNFIGTTDNIPLNIRVNNEKSGRIDHINGNTFFGHQSGNNNVIGQYNTAIGEQALFSNVNASFNTAVGLYALRYDTGYFNTAIGFQSLYVNTGGINNTATGAQSLSANITGKENTATGNSTLNDNTTGDNNTATGSLSLNNNTTGNNNTAIGYRSLLSNTTGSDNVALGINALIQNNTGFRNVALGSAALFSVSSGYENVAIGDSALLHYSPAGTGTPAVAVGSKALYHNAIGTNNTAVGAHALYSSTGNNNTALGFDALYSTLNGTDNTAAGYRALYANTSGGLNVAMGNYTLEKNVTGNQNVAIGYTALTNSTGSGNVGIGYQSAALLTTGSGNVAIGIFNNLQGGSSNNTLIGSNASVFGGSTYNYTTSIGAGSVANCSNCTLLGGDDPASRTRVGVNINAPATDLHIIQQSDNGADISRGIRLQRPNGNQWRTFIDPSNDYVFQLNNSLFSYIEPVGGTFISNSDERLKKDIQPMESTLSRILLLKPKTYHYTFNKDDDRRLYGFIAQDVEKLFPEFVFTSENGLKGIAYSNFAVVAVKALQEQELKIQEEQKENEQLKKEIAAQQQIITIIIKRLDALEKIKN